MEKLSEYFKTDSAYFGDEKYLNWNVISAQSRDSDCLKRSNFECFLNALGGESDTVKIIRAGHLACGWLEYLIINPEHEKSMTISEDILNALDNYPVINDEHYSETEMNEANEIWENCYDEK